MKIENLIENLKGVRSYHDDTWQDIITKLRQSKITVRGSGSYADVFTSPDWDYVYKIFQLDSAYMSFLHYCEQHQNNPHIPKILKKPKKFHSFHTRSHLSLDHLYAVKLEKLEEIPKTSKNSEIVDFVSDYAWQYIFRRNSQDPMRDPFDRENRSFEYTIDDIFKMYPNYPLEELFNTIKQINSYCRSELDLHEGNFMQRRDGTIVITDPVYNTTEITSTLSDLKKHTAPDDFRTILPHTKTIKGPKY